MLKDTSELLISSPFWASELQKLSNPKTLRMLPKLDSRFPCGINPEDKGMSWGEKKKSSIVDYLMTVKEKHPNKIVIIRIGDFYETYGIDSLFVVEYAGLNQMAHGLRAGAPLMNIQPLLDGLTSAGFSVAVCEQTDDPNDIGGKKLRHIAGIVTPASPTYTYGLLKGLRDSSFPEAPPVFAIAKNSKGFCLAEYDIDLRTVALSSELTIEAIMTRLLKYSSRLGEIYLLKEKYSELMQHHQLSEHKFIVVKNYEFSKFFTRVEELIKLDLNLSASFKFSSVKGLSIDVLQPKPIYFGTAKQIGILEQAGIPPLYDYLLPKDAPVTCKNLLKNWLLYPPPASTAGAMRVLISTLENSSMPLPDFKISHPSRFVKTIQNQEASHYVFMELASIVKSSLLALKHKEFTLVEKEILEILAHLSGVSLTISQLHASADKILSVLNPMLPLSEDLSHEFSFNIDGDFIFKDFFSRQEDEFRGRINPSGSIKVKKAYQNVALASENYEKAVTLALLPYGEGEQTKAKKLALFNAKIQYALKDDAIYFKTLSVDHLKADGGLKKAYDKKGKIVESRYTTEEMENTLNIYRDEIEKAKNTVYEVLKDISLELQDETVAIIQLAIFSNLMRTLTLHAAKTSQLGWSSSVSHQKDNSISLKNFFPYWMEKSQASANSIDISEVMVLTGHNMAGKSTLLRSIMTSTLLGASGLKVPAEKVSIPLLNGWFLRTGANDDPEAQLSAFGVEMSELVTILRDSDENTLVAIDELGKGTESISGSALAGAILEELKKKNIKGIFATHWHELWKNKDIFDIESFSHISMMVKNNRPLYKVIKGHDISSYALSIASEMGVNDEIISRAYQIANKISQYQTHSNKENLKTINFEEQLLKILVNDFYLSPEGKVEEGYTPPLKTKGKSILYILKTKKGFYYVGETDDLVSRLEAHRSEKQKEGASCHYFIISEGKSRAMQLEALIIKKLILESFPLLSSYDANQKNYQE